MSTSVADSVQDKPSYEQSGQWSLVWRRFRQQRGGLIALLVFLFLLLAVVAGPLVIPFDDSFTELPTKWLAPAGTVGDGGRAHFLGTDRAGKDELALLLAGGRVSLTIGLVSALLTTVIGVSLGSLAGFYRGRIDWLLMRSTDFLLSIPLLPLFILAAPSVRTLLISPLSFLPRTPRLFTSSDDPAIFIMTTMIVVFVIFGWMGISRLVRSSILSLRSQTFVEASRALGASNRRLIVKHLLPNALAPVLVAATFLVGDFVIWESILSYIGNGINSAFLPTWGNLIATSQSYVFRLALIEFNPFQDIRLYMPFMPAAMIFITVLSLNFIAEALRNALDPSVQV